MHILAPADMNLRARQDYLVTRAAKDSPDKAERTAALKEIGKRIRVERERKGMSKEALARYAGFADASGMGRVESGKQALDVLPLIGVAAALEATIDYLLTGKGPPPPGSPARPEDQDGRARAAR